MVVIIHASIFFNGRMNWLKLQNKKKIVNDKHLVSSFFRFSFNLLQFLYMKLFSNWNNCAFIKNGNLLTKRHRHVNDVTVLDCMRNCCWHLTYLNEISKCLSKHMLDDDRNVVDRHIRMNEPWMFMFSTIDYFYMITTEWQIDETSNHLSIKL